MQFVAHTLSRAFGGFPTRFLLVAMLCLFGCSAAPQDDVGEAEGAQQSALTAVVQINTGDGAVGSFVSDRYATGGSTYVSSNAITTSGVTNAAPASVYQSERCNNFSYTIPNLTAGASYVVRLHFAEVWFTSSGARVFNVLINGSQVITNLDIYATVGANKALVREFTIPAASNGQISIEYVNVVNNAKSSGIEVYSASSSSNAAPTVATPAAANPATTSGTTTALSVLGADDAGESNLTYTWSTLGTPPGSVSFSANGTNAAKNTTPTFGASGSYSLTVRIADGAGASVNSNVNVTVNSVAAPQTTYRINCGGGSVAPFASDQASSGGSTYTTGNQITTSGVQNAAPAAVYQSERVSNFSYTVGNLTPNASYTVRLHFAEVWFTSNGSRIFNVKINGAQVLTNFDIFAAGGLNTAVVREFAATANGSGQIVVEYVNVVNNAKCSAIEVFASSGQSNAAPTVATAASASPNPSSGTSSALSVLGADDGGEGNLTYTWASTGSPPASVAFSPNASNAAKRATATFSKAGSYPLSVTIKDPNGATTTSNVTVVVNQSLTSISVSPSSAQVASGGSQQFFATAKDQFGIALSTQPSISWTVTGGGNINTIGVFSAGSSSGGPFSVQATSGSTSGSANVTVTNGGAGSFTTNFDTTESKISEGGAWSTGLDPLTMWVSTANGIAFGTQSGDEIGSGYYNDSHAWLSGSFSANQRASAVIHRTGDSGGYLEVELLLRWSIGPRRTGTYGDTYSYGYEINLAHDAQYCKIARWFEPAICDSSVIQSLGVRDGDILSAEAVGNKISTSLTRNGSTTVLCSVTDNNAYASGSPGVGFYRGTKSGSTTNPTAFALKSFTATAL
jgi:malectin (di-glucose binding ER protein)/Big-like domain-containing protein/PKD domain-containing protein